MKKLNVYTYIYFLIENDELLEKYNTIFDISAVM